MDSDGWNIVKKVMLIVELVMCIKDYSDLWKGYRIVLGVDERFVEFGVKGVFSDVIRIVL